MPFYQDFSDENATIFFWKYDDEDYFNDEELIEPENYQKVENYHPKRTIIILFFTFVLPVTRYSYGFSELFLTSEK